MSELYPIMEDIIAALNTKYATDVSAETIDIKWLGEQLTSHSFSGGVKGLTKRMEGKFNKHLINEIELAAKKFGDLRGIAKYLSNYRRLKDTLKKDKNIRELPKTERFEITAPVRKVNTYLNKVRDKFPKDYEDSYYEHTEKVLAQLQKYQKSGEKNPSTEQNILALFMYQREKEEQGIPEVAKNEGLVKNWRVLNVKGISGEIKEIYEKFSHYADRLKGMGEKEVLELRKEKDKSPVGIAISNLLRKTKALSDKDKEVNKEMKGEKRKKIRDIDKDVDKDEASKDQYDYGLEQVREYLKKAKTSFDQEFNKKPEKKDDKKEEGTQTLHKYTEEFLNNIEAYYKGDGRDKGVNELIKTIFSESPGIIKKWDELNKNVSKNLRKVKSGVAKLVKTLKDEPSSVDNKIVIKFQDLKNLGVETKPEDRTISESLSGKVKKKPDDSGTSFFPLVNKIVRNKTKIPEKFDPDKLGWLGLTDEEKNNKNYMETLKKAVNFIQKTFAEDKDISNNDLAIKALEMLTKEPEKKKDPEKKEKPVLDRKLEDSRGVPHGYGQTKSSINIVNDYKESLFYKLESLATKTSNKLVKAELEDICRDIKQLI